MKLGRSFMNFCRQFLVNVTFAHVCYAKHKTHFIVRNLLGVNDIATHRKISEYAHTNTGSNSKISNEEKIKANTNTKFVNVSFERAEKLIFLFVFV